MRNISGIISNMMVEETQGTNNEPFHSFLNKSIPRVGGGRLYGYLSACIAFTQYCWNGVIQFMFAM